MCKFSVVVPIYKVEQYLPKCIESLIKQTLEDIEIILVDDGSPDKCGEICDYYSSLDDRIKVIHKKNEGVSAARNDGLKVAKGDWILFCDSDDWMEENALEILYRTGEDNKVDLVIADVYKVYNEKQVYNQLFSEQFTYRSRDEIAQLIRQGIYHTYNPLPPDHYTNTGYGGPWNKAVRREILVKNNIEFDLSVKSIGDDLLYVLATLSSVSSVSYIQKPVYNYRILENSTLHSYKPTILESNENIFKGIEIIINSYCRLHEKDRELFLEPYYAHVFRRMVDSLSFYFFNPKREEELATTLNKLKKVLECEPYKTSILKLNPDTLTKYNNLQWRMAKHNFVMGMFLLYKMSISGKKIISFINSKKRKK